MNKPEKIESWRMTSGPAREAQAALGTFTDAPDPDDEWACGFHDGLDYAFEQTHDGCRAAVEHVSQNHHGADYPHCAATQHPHQDAAIVQAIIGLPSRLKAHRAARHLSQREVAKRAGISFSTVSRIEAGEDYVVSSLVALAAYLSGPDA